MEADEAEGGIVGTIDVQAEDYPHSALPTYHTGNTSGTGLLGSTKVMISAILL